MSHVKEKSVETVPEKDQVVNLLDKDFKTTVVKIPKEDMVKAK